MLKKTSIITQDFLFSRFCYLCLKPRSHLFAFCRPCLKQLSYIKKHCPQCGMALLTQQLCGQCLQKKINPIFNTIPTFNYQGLIKEAVLQLKFYKGLFLSQPLSRLMHHKIRPYYQSNASKPEALICVPLHRKKMRLRGYNQSQLLTKQLSKMMRIPNISGHIKKIKSTCDQSTLPLKDRQKNMKNAFFVSKKLPNHVAIIDDVMTTGETVKELASLLKRHGVKKVDVWCLARTAILKQ